MYGLTGYICRRYVNVCGVIWALGAINVNINIYVYVYGLSGYICRRYVNACGVIGALGAHRDIDVCIQIAHTYFVPHPRSGVVTVDVVLARLEADFSAQPPSIPAVPSRRVSLQCPTTKYPCSAQPPRIPAVPNRRVSLQCPTTKYPCSAHPTAKYPCSAQPQSILAQPHIPAVLNH